ncbi:MAG: GNAT family N-acetyltransferase [Bacteroidota bacterium]
MKDLLVRLMELPESSALEKKLEADEKIVVKRPIAPERSIVTEWVAQHFGSNWKNEMEAAFNTTPTHCYIAIRDQNILGFACFECTAKNFFGPTGVLETEQGKGIGKLLLLKALEALKNMGYAYAIIGGVGPVEYYRKAVGAQEINGSEISVYQHLLKHPK